jgi:hypothetical protein
MASLSQARPLEDLPSSHSAFQEHAAHMARWPAMLSSKGSWGVGRIRARYLTARLPNPPVRPVRETFTSYGSRQRDIMGKVHFASSTVHSPWTACAFAGYLCTVSRPSPSGPSPWTSLSYARTTMAYLTAWRALEFRWALACLLSTLLPIPARLSRVHRRGLKAECCRWRVSPCPFHSLWLPRHSMG